MEPLEKTNELTEDEKVAHSLVLEGRSLKGGERAKFNVKLDFSVKPKPNDINNHQKKEVTSSINPIDLLPVFTTSSRPELKGFISKGEKEIVSAESKEFFEKIESKNGLKFGVLREIKRPNPVLSYCQICKETFDDYLQHIWHPSHEKMARQSKSTKMIEDLLQSFEWSSKRPRSEKNINVGDSGEEEDEEEMFSPTKKQISQSGQTLLTHVLTKSRATRIETISSFSNIKIHKEETLSATPLLYN